MIILYKGQPRKVKSLGCRKTWRGIVEQVALYDGQIVNIPRGAMPAEKDDACVFCPWYTTKNERS